MVKLILADGTELKGFKQNGNNYVSKTEVDVSVFEDNLSTLTIVDGDTQMVMHNAELFSRFSMLTVGISASVKRLSRKCAMLNLWANLSTWQ